MKALLKSALVALALPSMGEPLPPIEAKLDAQVILQIPIHPKVQTLLFFPEPVAMATGEGVTGGEKEGQVYVQPAQDERVLIVKPLKAEAEVLMHVLVGGEAYVFRLKESERPASLVKFADKVKFSPAREVSREHMVKSEAIPSEERQLQLVRFAQNAEVLKEQLPEDFKNYDSRNFNEIHHGENFSTQLLHIARFPNERTMVIFGTVTNTSSRARRPTALFLEVGGVRRYPLPSHSLVRDTLKPGEQHRSIMVLTGDEDERPIQLSLENDFKLVF